MQREIKYCDVCGESGHHLVVIVVQGYRLDICHNLAATRCASKLSLLDVLKLLDRSQPLTRATGEEMKGESVVSSTPVVVVPTEAAVPVPPPPSPGPPAEVTPEVAPQALQLTLSDAPTRSVDLSDLAAATADEDDED